MAVPDTALGAAFGGAFGTLKGRLSDAAYAAGWGLVRAAPPSLARASFARAADAASVRNGAGTRRLRANLRRVVGPAVGEVALDELVGQALRSYARYWMETFRLPAMDHAAVVAATEQNMTGIDHLDAALARGRGVVVALPHQGNWDVAGLWLVAHSGTFVTVAERLRPESLYDRFVAYRESLGFEVLPLTGGAQAPTGVLTQRLRENKVVCLVADRDLSRHGVPVSFFGEAARLPGGPALLAATTGASLHVASCWFTEEGWGQSVSPPIEVGDAVGARLRDRVPALTQTVAHLLEEAIRAHPADWHMLQRLWTADLPPQRRDG